MADTEPIKLVSFYANKIHTNPEFYAKRVEKNDYIRSLKYYGALLKHLYIYYISYLLA